MTMLGRRRLTWIAILVDGQCGGRVLTGFRLVKPQTYASQSRMNTEHKQEQHPRLEDRTGMFSRSAWGSIRGMRSKGTLTSFKPSRMFLTTSSVTR